MKGLINYHKRNLQSFNEVTRFRLVVLMVILIIIEVTFPSITQLQGTYLHIHNWEVIPATIIAGFGIIKLILQKFGKRVLKTTKPSVIFKAYVIISSFWMPSLFLYFYDPTLMIWVYSILGIIDGFIMFVYSTTISNFMVYFEHDKYTKFQNYRNDILTELGLIGAILSFVISYFFGIGGVILFTNCTVGTFFMYYTIKNYNLLDTYDFAYMMKYHRGLRK